MGKISMFGISGSGKTCYLYAMAHLLCNVGLNYKDNCQFSIKATDPDKQGELDNGYLEMKKGVWPKNTGLDEINEFNSNLDENMGGELICKDYEFKVRFGYEMDGRYKFDDNTFITIADYAGGWWKERSYRKKLISHFRNSSAIVCFIDGETLLKALDSNDIDPIHRWGEEEVVIDKAKQDIGFVENMIEEYKNKGDGVPPILIAITKADVFTSTMELEKGKDYLKKHLPSLFAKGSGVETALTAISLGRNLGKDNNNHVIGNIEPSMEFNLHIPIVYGYSAWLDETFRKENPDDERASIVSQSAASNEMMKGRVEMYKNGEPLIFLGQ